MIKKDKEKQLAIKLRQRGLSYSEILKKVSVAKSTLSLWLREVGLSKKQEQALTDKRRTAGLRGALKRKQQRIATTNKIKKASSKEIGRLSNREKWLIGTALYWAEGTKQREHSISQKTKLINSDPLLIRFFLDWLLKIVKIQKRELNFEIYIHSGANIEKAKNFWSKIVKIKKSNFKIRLKKPNPHTKRKNIGNDYIGLLAIEVKKSTNLNRRISGWINGITKQ